MIQMYNRFNVNVNQIKLSVLEGVFSIMRPTPTPRAYAKDKFHNQKRIQLEGGCIRR
jgi:hypothetical protein